MLFLLRERKCVRVCVCSCVCMFVCVCVCVCVYTWGLLLHIICGLEQDRHIYKCSFSTSLFSLSSRHLKLTVNMWKGRTPPPPFFFYMFCFSPPSFPSVLIKMTSHSNLLITKDANIVIPLSVTRRPVRGGGRPLSPRIRSLSARLKVRPCRPQLQVSDSCTGEGSALKRVRGHWEWCQSDSRREVEKLKADFWLWETRRIVRDLDQTNTQPDTNTVRRICRICTNFSS